MAISPIEEFRRQWEYEASTTSKLLKSLPTDQYDFRPDEGARSIGEMSWHLAEIEGYIALGIEAGNVDFTRHPDFARPKTIQEIASGYDKVHQEAVKRLQSLTDQDLTRSIPFMNRDMRIYDILTSTLLHHLIHHRAQLSTMCRLAGGVSPGAYGPNREETAAMMSARKG